MSLLATASVWDSNNNNKGNESSTKRISTMGFRNKTAKQPRSTTSSHGEYETDENFLVSTQMPSSIAEHQANSETKQNRVHEMLNHITGVNIQNDGSGLADFVPLSSPTTRKPTFADSGLYAGNVQHELLPKPPKTRESMEPRKQQPPVMPNGSSLGKYSNYQSAYAAPRMGPVSAGAVPGVRDDRMMEKINYMIRLLEEQQLEKTNNITEEFILYTMLGVFVIYIVDSFSRAGKYMR